TQEPDWHWARVLVPNGSGQRTLVATNEGGCYVQNGSTVVRYNDFGDQLWSVDFSDRVQLFRTADGSTAGFILQYEDSSHANGMNYYAPPGISFLTGLFDSDGSMYEVQNFPAILITETSVTIADTHRGPAGDLLLIGHFQDSLQVMDTVITGISHSGFLVRLAMNGDLHWTMSLMNTSQGDIGGTSAHVKQHATGDIYINLGAPYPGSLSDTLFEQGGSAFARFTSEGELIWNSITEGGSLAGDRVLFDLRSDGGLYYTRETAGMSNGVTFVGALGVDGELIWETPAIDYFYPSNVSVGPNGVLFSGTRYGPLDLQGCAYVPSSSPRTFMIQFENNDECEWIKNSPDPANAFNGYAVEGPQGIYYTTGAADWSSFLVFGTDTVQFQGGGSQPYIARLGVLPMSNASQHSHEINPMKVYPNPSKDQLFISVPQNLKGANASLFDFLGRSAGSYTLNTSTEQIDITGLAAGNYILRSHDQYVRVVIE
ncbi:MAG: T9SS type A sorting domain-containing protein, partial [Bacteroidota bacterium]|nr:T9SS type A sorting domain-containing protein [Bacteroidota bacterium]